MSVVQENLLVVRQKIGRQINSDGKGNRDGVLTHRPEEYLRCLDLAHRRLSDLLIADLKHWTDNLETQKTKAKALAVHMSELL